MGSAFYSYKNKQQGAATLLVTALLLLAALVITLISYKNVFFQIKRAQNEIEARKEHWSVEGGLECAYTKMYQDRDQSVLVSGTTYFDSDCVEPMGLSAMRITPLSGKKYVVQPEFEQTGISFSRVSKVIDFSRNRSTGAIKATADLYIRGTGTFNPPDPGNELAGGWECVGLRYKNNFEMIGAIDNKQFYSATNYPSSSFNPNGKQCLSSNVTTSTTNLKHDFQYDDDLEPFQEAFEVSSNLWSEVRDNPIYDFDTIETSSLVVSSASVNPASKCGEAVKNKIESGSTRIWVEGSCELYNDPVATQPQWLSEIATATQDTEGVLLLVHNGIFSIHGSGEFKGALFHINNSFTPTASDWNGLYGESVKNQLSSYFPSVPTSVDITYVQNGSFVFTGGQSLDLNGQIAYFNNGLDFKYNSDVLDSIFGVLPPRWLKGSWNDF